MTEALQTDTPWAVGSNDGLGVSARAPKIGRKWRRMAEMYKRFACDYKAADFSESAALAMYLHESTGAPLPDPRTNGYALGKKWMDVTVAGWKEEIPQMGLLVSELQADGYPDWFLERVGVLHLVPTRAACAWWLETPNVLSEDRVNLNTTAIKSGPLTDADLAAAQCPPCNHRCAQGRACNAQGASASSELLQDDKAERHMAAVAKMQTAFLAVLLVAVCATAAYFMPALKALANN